MDLEPIKARAPYSEAIVLKALACLASHGGKLTVAAAQVDVPVDAIARWRKSYPNRYAKFQRESEHELERRLTSDQIEIAAQATSIERKFLDHIEQEFDAGHLTSKEVLANIKNVSTVKGIASDKLLSLTGRPVHGQTENRSVAELMRSLQAKVNKAGITAEVVEDKEPPKLLDGPSLRDGRDDQADQSTGESAIEPSSVSSG